MIAIYPTTTLIPAVPKNVDKDPAWRATAIYGREESARLISDPVISPERRILNAIKGLTGMRHGEAAGVRWELLR
jgi:integrase